MSIDVNEDPVRAAEEAALAVARDAGFQREVAQVRARAALEELPGDGIEPQWRYLENRVVRNAAGALLALKSLAAIDRGYVETQSGAALQLARFWEGYSKLKRGAARDTALANSATAYEIAGYQANAACLSRDLGSLRGSDPQLTDFVAAFLQRFFLALRESTAEATAEPPVTPISAIDSDEVDLTADLMTDAALAAAAAGLRAGAAFFLSGNAEALNDAERLLALGARGYVSMGLMPEANLVESVRTLLPIVAGRSTWQQIGDIEVSDPRWSRYLKLLARGLGNDPYSSPSISELWPSQREAIRKGLLGDHDSKVVRLPTSAGKTRIAELAIVHTLLSEPDARCIYVAPYRALVTEIERGLFALFSDLGLRVASATGAYDADQFEAAVAGEARVLVVTPEKLDLLSRLRPDLLASTRLLVVDEGHVVGDANRGPKLDLLVSRFRVTYPELRVLMLSAVVSEESLADFAAWFGADQDDIVDLDWRPAVHRIAMLDWRAERAILRYAREGESEVLSEFVPGIAERRTFRHRHPATRRIRAPVFPAGKNKSQMAAEAAFRFADLGPVLVFCTQPRYVMGVAKALSNRLELARLTGDTVPGHFATPDTRAAVAASEWLGEAHEVTKHLREGIAVHHGQLADVIRQAVELDFRQRRYRVLVATNTLAQGVNLPIRTVIVHSVWRRSEDRSERLPPRDYWNIAGRAGRAGEETEGTLIHLVADNKDLRDYEYYLGAPRRTSVDSALFADLKALVTERLSETALADQLDPEILALLIEEQDEDEIAASIERVLRGTLAAAQASRSGIEIEPLQRVMTRRANAIASELEDPVLLPVFSSTGLTARSCEALREHAEERRELLEVHLREPLEAPIDLATICLDACSRIEEVEPQGDFAGSYADLLGEWLGGEPIDQLRADFGEDAGGPDQLTRLIDGFFGYGLPWGSNSYLRIAAAILGIPSDEITDGARFLPSMIKHGVPVAAASWAITAGIPSRRLALEIASAYLQNAQPSYRSFMTWLSSLDPEDFREQFGVTGYLVDDLAVALDRSVYNPLIAEHPEPLRSLPRDVTLRGVSASSFTAAAEAGVGTTLDLERIYGDPVSRNAVEAQVRGRRIGYLPRREAQLLAPEIDAGAKLRAEITGIERTPRTIELRVR